MVRTVVEIVKVVAPPALEALAQAAVALIGGLARSTVSFKNTQDNGSIIFNDTVKYVNTQFSDNYRYFYKGLGSTPPGASIPLVGASEDIMVWNPAKNEDSDIQDYIKLVLQDTLPDSDTIEVSQNLSSLFQSRFTQVDLSWTPFTKRYNLSDSGVIIDLEMVTAAGYDANNNPLGIATWCFVAYNRAK
jgi:hypothetical protein